MKIGDLTAGASFASRKLHVGRARSSIAKTNIANPHRQVRDRGPGGGGLRRWWRKMRVGERLCKIGNVEEGWTLFDSDMWSVVARMMMRACVGSDVLVVGTTRL